MAFLPRPVKCDVLRCQGERVAGSAFCETHGGKPKQSAARYESNAAYKGALWAGMRARQLSSAPLCASCLARGQITQAQAVDHVFPWRQIAPAAFTRNLFQSLCIPCHSLKSGLEQKGAFIHYTERGEIEYTRADYAKVTANL